MELHLANLRGKPGSTGTASILVDKNSGHVLEVTSNSAAFTDAEFALFASFPELRALTLWHNGSFDGSGLAHLQKLPRLERITLAGGGLADAGLREAAKISTMKELRAWHARFTDAGIAALRGHPALESIAVGPSWEKLLTDKTLESIASCPKLKKLSITETWLTWEGGLRHLVKCKDLTKIDLGNCLIAPAEVARLRSEMPAATIEWRGWAAAGADFSKKWVRSKAEAWIPKEMIEKAIAENAAAR